MKNPSHLWYEIEQLEEEIAYYKNKDYDLNSEPVVQAHKLLKEAYAKLAEIEEDNQDD